MAAGDDRCDERSGSTAPLTPSSSEEWEQSISSLWNIKAGVSGLTTLLIQLSLLQMSILMSPKDSQFLTVGSFKTDIYTLPSTSSFRDCPRCVVETCLAKDYTGVRMLTVSTNRLSSHLGRSET